MSNNSNVYNKIKINKKAWFVAMLLLVVTTAIVIFVGKDWKFRTVIPEPQIVNNTAKEELEKVFKFHVVSFFGNLLEEIAVEVETELIENESNAFIVSMGAEFNGSVLTIVFDYDIQLDEIDEEFEVINKCGHYFNDWNEAESKRRIVKNKGTINAYYEYIADWKPEQYTLKFDAQNGTAVEDLIVVYGQKELLEKSSRYEYEFMGWESSIHSFFSDASCEIEIIDFGEHNSTIIMTALWERIYTITLDMQDGIEGDSSFEVKFNDEMPTNLIAPIRTGYDFMGYFTKKNGTGEHIFDELMLPVIELWKKSENTILYAKWTPINYEINYKLEEGEVNNSDNVSFFTIESEDIILFEPSKIGYVFDGWYTDEFLLEKIETIKQGSCENITLYPKWELITYNIYYVNLLNGHNSQSNPSKFNIHTPQIELEDAERTGYIFDGWFNDDILIKSIPTGSHDDVTLNAKWTPKTYVVELNHNGGTGGTTFVTATYDEKLPTDEMMTVPKRDGYNFIGYWDAITAGNRYYFPDLTGDLIWDKDEDGVILYAQWKVSEVYNIVYQANRPPEASSNVSNTMAESEMIVGEFLPLRTNTYSLLGWSFICWNTVSDGSGTSYEDGEVISADIREVISDSVCLYAQWVANTYKVTYNYKNATSGNTVKDKTLTYDAKYSLDVPERIGYAFVGWEDGEKNILTNKQGDSLHNWTIADDVEIFAIWEANEYDVIFHYGDATGNNSQPTKTVTYDQTFILVIPQKEGETFLGWFSLPNGQGTCYTDWNGVGIEKWTETTDVDLYAYFDVVLIFNYENATSNYEESYRVMSDTSVVGSLPIPQKTSYEFDGWWTEPMGSGDKYEWNTPSVNVSTNLYVKWVMKIEFDYQDEIGNTTYKYVVYKAEIGDLPQPTKNENTFLGWFTSPDGTGIQYTENTIIYADNSIKLYAMWETKITFIYQNYENDDTTMRVIYGLSVNCYENLPEPTSGGYNFIGWSMSIKALESDEIISNDYIYRSHTPIVLYAQWEKNNDWFLFDDINAITGLSVVWINSPRPEKYDLIIPNSIDGKVVTSISTGAFSNITSLTSVELPNSVTEIMKNAFINCSNLSIIKGGEGVVKVGENAFAGTEFVQYADPNKDEAIRHIITVGKVIIKYIGTTNVTKKMLVDTNATTIGPDAFKELTYGISIVIPNSINKIDNGAFQDSSITSITIELSGKDLSIDLESIYNGNVGAFLKTINITPADKITGSFTMNGGNANLATFTCTGSGIQSIILQNFISISQLNLYKNALTNVSFGTTEIDNLILTGNRLGHSNNFDLKNVNAKYVNLVGNGVGVGGGTIVCSQTNTTIRSLFMPSDEEYNTTGSGYLANKLDNLSFVDKLTNLVCIDVANNMVANLGQLLSLTKLKELYLGGNPIIYDAKELEKIANNTLFCNQIERINLGGEKDGVPAKSSILKILNNCINATWIQAYNLGLSKNEIMTLFQENDFRALSYLKITNNSLSSSEINELKTFFSGKFGSLFKLIIDTVNGGEANG